MALKPHVDAITGTDHVLQHKDRNLKALGRLKSAAYGLGCYIPDLKEDIETMALEAKEVMDWQEISVSEQGCVTDLIDTIQAELERGAKWDGPTVYKRVKAECTLSPSEVEYGAIVSPRGPPREEYEVIGVETTQELFDVLRMGKLPQKREELR
ncbi:hypothetical protein LCGC14_0610180 [marine sediment metagenome]|uniref:Uncharacterized protein n=1 Tax=marine sediment metagenome TaxID=412755 RepID=A0A0F9R810_9ZZZZ